MKKTGIICGAALFAFIMVSGSVQASESGEMRQITDGAGREVEIPETVESIVCSGVGALRYTCYMQAQDLVVGVEDYETKAAISRGYSWVNGEKFAELPVIGANGEPYPEEIITVDPDVIIVSARAGTDADQLQQMTGIPVVVVPGSDDMLDDMAYETLRIMGAVYRKEERAQELTEYLNQIKEDLDKRTADIPEEEKLSVYVGGVSFQGTHGFGGTEAGYGPFAAIHAANVADLTEQTGACLVILGLILAAAVFFSLWAGSYETPASELLRGIFGQANDPKINVVVRNVRLPRICTAMIAGAGLGVVGCILQVILGNPLASASTLGVSQGVVVLAACVFFFLHRWDFNALLAGTETAVSLGIPVRRLILANMVLCCFTASAIVSYVGLINFIGLVAPHIVRRLVGNNHIYLIPGSILTGASLLLLGDLFARTIVSPVILPIGAITSFLGAPLFLYLLFKGRKGSC